MKAVAAFVFLTSVSLTASGASPERVQFTGTLQLDDSTPVALDLQLPSNKPPSFDFPMAPRLSLRHQATLPAPMAH